MDFNGIICYYSYYSYIINLSFVGKIERLCTCLPHVHLHKRLVYIFTKLKLHFSCTSTKRVYYGRLILGTE